MIKDVLLLYILIRLQAPTWCYWLVGISMTITIVQLLCAIYKSGKESR